jgi:putative OPT family oligopeptide transporter
MSVHPPIPTDSAREPGEATATASTGGPAHQPYVPDGVRMPELTWSGVLLGSILGIVFGASSLYLVLRVGMTVSASIPVAVLSITLFRAFSKILGTRPATILENNIVQTTGSAGESIAFGVGVTMPALMILGYDMDLGRVMLVAGLGGLLGILMMIPLRRAFIVKQHGLLTYPEGTACAKVLIVGEQGGTSAKTVFTGFGLAFVYQVLMQGLKLWQEFPERAIGGYKAAVVSLEANPILMGVGYIIGVRTSCVMVGGGILAALVFVPTIAFFGANAAGPIYPGTKLISSMTPEEIQGKYVLYIGAGAVATGGVISLLQALPLILGSIRSGLGDLLGAGVGREDEGQGRLRTERDLPLWLVGLGTLGLVAAIATTHLMPDNVAGRVVGAVLIVLCGFLFVTVSSRLTGEIGSSSNPISGMTVATLLLTCLIFVLRGWVGPEYRLAALSIAGIVCIAASNGGTTSQDLKTGYLVGATPWMQQVSILIGALSSAVVIGFTLLLLNDAGTIVTANPRFLPTVRADVAALKETATHEGKTYHVWRVVEPSAGVEPGKYLVDEAGAVRYLVDPAINGNPEIKSRDDGALVTRYKAPKATLMAFIIDGIMTQKLPWGLVLIGVFLAIVMQLAGVPALAFAVGVYLPLSTSTPIFVGGLVRGAVDWYKKTTPEESDSSPAVLLSSGYIAGGAIAGILIALLAVIPIPRGWGASSAWGLIDLSRHLPKGWNESPAPALVAFGLMTLLLLLVGLGVVLRPGSPDPAKPGAPARENSTRAGGPLH